MQTIHAAALRTANELTWRLSIFIGFLLALLVSSFIAWSTYFRVATGVTAVNEQISHLILVGDTFQLKTQLLSLASSGIIDHFLLKEPGGTILAGNDVQEISQFEENIRPQSSFEIGRIDGSFQVIRTFVIQGLGNRNSTLVVSKRLPVEMFLFMLIAIVFSFFLTHKIFRKLIMNLAENLTDPISDLAAVVSQTQSYSGLEENKKLKASLKYQELHLTLDSFLNLLRRLKNAEDERATAEKEAALTQIATQVAHDIRSPVTALNVISHTAQNLTEEERTLLRSATQRINDIANSLLLKNKLILGKGLAEEKSLISFSSGHQKVMVAQVLDLIGCEKRSLFNINQNIRLDVDIASAYGLFVQAEHSGLSRAISNLLSNSIEAMTSNSGTITVKAREIRGEVEIVITDDGAGISPEILKSLGKRGVTQGKEYSSSGTGLGFYHAKKTLEDMAGKVNIESTLSKGTTVTITLPMCEPPQWYVKSLEIPTGVLVVSVDDDPSVHQVWKRRLSEDFFEGCGFDLINFTTPLAFDTWITSENSGSNIFLMDHEFYGSELNGLNLIEKHGLGKQSILVSSVDNEAINNQAIKLGVKIIPKIMIPFVPIVRTRKVITSDDKTAVW